MGMTGKMTADEAAKLIGIDGTTFRRKLKTQNIIPYERHGWAYVLNADDVWAYKQNYKKFARSKKAQ